MLALLSCRKANRCYDREGIVLLRNVISRNDLFYIVQYAVIKNVKSL